MADKRPVGRPKAQNPRNIRLGVWLSEREADDVYRLSAYNPEGVSGFIREAVKMLIAMNATSPFRARDNQVAQQARERRKARRAEHLVNQELEARLGKGLSERGEDLQT